MQMSNPMYQHPDIKMEGAGRLIKPALAPHLHHNFPHSSLPRHHRIQTQPMSSSHMMAANNYETPPPPTTTTIPRVSSLEAELDKLIASTVDPCLYPNYLPNYSSPLLSHDSPPYMSTAYSTSQAMDSTAMNHIGGGMVQDGGASSHSSPGLGTDTSMAGGAMAVTSVSPQDPTVFSYAPSACTTDPPYSMSANQLTAYSCPTCPTTSTTSTTNPVPPGGQQPLQHLPTYTGPTTSLQQGDGVFSHAPTSGPQYLGPVSTSTPPATSSVAYSQHHMQNGSKPAYTTALQNVSMHGRPSPPLQPVSGFSPAQQGTVSATPSNNSPSSYGYLSPPKEPEEYQQQLYGSSYLSNCNSDALSCLTPSPEDFSNHGNERSPPGQTTTVHTLGHYEQYQLQHCGYDYGTQSLSSHINAPQQLVTYNSRESIV